MKMIWIAAIIAVLTAALGIGWTVETAVGVQAQERKAYGLLKLQERVRFLGNDRESVVKVGADDLLEPGQWLAQAIPDDLTKQLKLEVLLGRAPAALNAAGAAKIIEIISESHVSSGAVASRQVLPGPLWMGFARAGDRYWIIGQGEPEAKGLLNAWIPPATHIFGSISTGVAVAALVLSVLMLLRRKPSIPPVTP